MKYVFIVFSFCLCIPCQSQTTISSPFKGYQFSSDILKDLHNDTSSGDNKYQMAATFLSWIGEYDSVLTIWDVPNGKGPAAPSFVYDYFRKCKAYDARLSILEQAKTHQIIMINEEHHQPQDRVFTESLLPELYKIGYRFFGAETLNYQDTALNRRGYPVLKTGFYTYEPEYGNLVRTALKTGFTVFAYEQKFGTNQGSMNRELAEAQNIKEILDKNPGAKIIIHCGYGHLSKTKFSGFTPMAFYVHQLTGVDPYCIDQTRLIEKSSKEYECLDYKILDFDSYAVFEDSNGKVFNGFIDMDLDSIQDVSIYHPRTKWVQGRPNWVFKNGRGPFILKKKIKTSYPCLVFAYADGEDIKEAVPVDIIELKRKEEIKALALAKGKYTIVIKDKKGGLQTLKVEK